MSPYRVTRRTDAREGLLDACAARDGGGRHCREHCVETCHQSRWLYQVRKIERFLCSLRAAFFLRQVLLHKQTLLKAPGLCRIPVSLQ